MIKIILLTLLMNITNSIFAASQQLSDDCAVVTGTVVTEPGEADPLGNARSTVVKQDVKNLQQSMKDKTPEEKQKIAREILQLIRRAELGEDNSHLGNS